MRFTVRTLQALELFERDPQLFGLMAFEGPVQALLEQFVQRGLGCAFGFFDFAFPKHKLLLLDAESKKQTFSELGVRCRV